MEEMSKHLVVNCYPRSGSLFFSNFLSRYQPELDFIHSTHIPYILDNPYLYMVSVIRNPYEVMSSHLYRNMQHIKIDDINKDNVFLINTILGYLKEYKVYVDYYYKCLDKKNFHLVDFESMKSDPTAEAIKIFEKFNISYNKDILLQSSVISDFFSSNGLIEEYGGHMPREKTEKRIHLDNFTNGLDIIDETFKKYLVLKKML
jgi:hypothetical protein